LRDVEVLKSGCADDEEMSGSTADARTASGTIRIVMVTGFESFNVDLYKKASDGIACVHLGIMS
jgi:hypothetical protein